MYISSLLGARHPCRICVLNCPQFTFQSLLIYINLLKIDLSCLHFHPKTLFFPINIPDKHTHCVILGKSLRPLLADALVLCLFLFLIFTLSRFRLFPLLQTANVRTLSVSTIIFCNVPENCRSQRRYEHYQYDNLHFRPLSCRCCSLGKHRRQKSGALPKFTSQ